MQLYIIRHCQSENNALWLRTGSSDGRLADPPLTELGHKQAAQLAQFMAGQRGSGTVSEDDPLDRRGIELTHLYCSLMIRSIETGQYIADALGLPLVAREDIHERGGIYLEDPNTNQKNGLPGLDTERLSRQFPAVTPPDSLGPAGWWNRPYENRQAAHLRAHSFLQWLLAAHDGTDDRVGIVTHGGFSQSLFSALFGVSHLQTNLGKNREIWLKFNNGSVTRFDFFEDVVRLAYQNRVDFIPEYLLS